MEQTTEQLLTEILFELQSIKVLLQTKEIKTEIHIHNPAPTEPPVQRPYPFNYGWF